MNFNDDFGKDMNNLLSLLRKILKKHKLGGADASSILDKPGKEINLNLCFFTFIPVHPEELMDLEAELESLGGEFLKTESNPELKFELNVKDLEFLKKNGIKF